MIRVGGDVCLRGIVLCLAVLNAQTLLSKGCHKGEVLVGEDENFWYCARRSDFPEPAANLVFALEDAARKVNPGKSLDLETQDKNCSAFFRLVGKKIGAKGDEWTLRNTKDERHKKKPVQANDIVKMISENKEGKWEKIRGNEEDVTRQVQELANNGLVVVATQIGSNHGHLAIASPLPPKVTLSNFAGHGPMVRDGNVHPSGGHKKSTGLGTARASYAFGGYSSDPPTWYLWLPSRH
jgi:hypothetical protein